jgi:hypothetical protein
MTTDRPRDGKVKVMIRARDDNDEPLINLDLRGKVTTPTGKAEAENRADLDFKQIRAGVYEAEFKAEETGSYFINVQSWGPVTDKDGNTVMEAKDGARSAVTISYSPEYADLETNIGLLEKLRALTDGETFADTAASLDEVVSTHELFRKAPAFSKSVQPIWYWLLFAAAVLLFFDVASRRISLDYPAVAAAVVAGWNRLRGRRVTAERAPEFIDRLRARKAQVGESIDQGKKERRYEGTAPPSAAPAGADETKPPLTASPQQPPKPAPRSSEEGGDYLSRLKKAKKRAMEDRDKPKDEE